MPDWTKLNKELDDALNSMTEVEWHAFQIKSKVDALTERFYYTLPNNGSFTGPNNVNDRWVEARQCAIVAVQELLDEVECIQALNELSADYVTYWTEVLKELNTLNETE
jgi:hypothetical protein